MTIAIIILLYLAGGVAFARYAEQQVDGPMEWPVFLVTVIGYGVLAPIAAIQSIHYDHMR